MLMVVYDFALEPAAIDLNMWDWGGPVPMQNYIAWLVISLVLTWFDDRTGFVNGSADTTWKAGDWIGR